MSQRELRALEEEAKRRGEENESATRSSRTRSGQAYQAENTQAHAKGKSESESGGQVTTTSHGEQTPTTTSVHTYESEGASALQRSELSLDFDPLAHVLDDLFEPFFTHTETRNDDTASTAQKTVTFAPAHKSTPDQNKQQTEREIQNITMTAEPTSRLKKIYDNMLVRRSNLVDEYLTHLEEADRT